MPNPQFHCNVQVRPDRHVVLVFSRDGTAAFRAEFDLAFAGLLRDTLIKAIRAAESPEMPATRQ